MLDGLGESALAQLNGGQAITSGRMNLVELQDLLITANGGIDVAGPLVAKS